jgi:hypothetical protein
MCLRVALILAVSGCSPLPHLAASCTLAPSRSTWTTTANVGRVEGEVRDLGFKGPVGNLEVRLVDLDRRQRTDGQGAFRFDSVPEGRHVLVTEGSVYQARGDTLVVPPDSGIKGVLGLNARRDVLANCPMYHP